MIGLHPIIRRARRPLVQPEVPAAAETIVPTAVPPVEVQVVATAALPRPEAKAGARPGKARRADA